MDEAVGMQLRHGRQELLEHLPRLVGRQPPLRRPRKALVEVAACSRVAVSVIFRLFLAFFFFFCNFWRVFDDVRPFSVVFSSFSDGFGAEEGLQPAP